MKVKVIVGRPRRRLRDFLKWILKKNFIKSRLYPSGCGYRKVTAFCEHGNEHSGSLKGGEFIGQVNDYPLFKYSYVQ
jgi:hypothetical protein